MRLVRRVLRVTRIALALSLSIVLPACAPVPPAANSPPAKPAPNAPTIRASSASDVQRIEQAIHLIETNYYEKISRSALDEACLSALKEPYPGSAGPSAGRMAIAAALERTRTEHPGQEYSRASEQCLQGIVSTLNRHSAYIAVREFREMQVGGPRLAGIGVELAAADQGARVVAALEGTPAERAGLKKGELLIRIDDRDLAGMPLSEIVRLLRGEPYSTVRITLGDSAASEPRTVTLERELIQLESVRTRLIEPGLAFVRVTQFDTRAPKKIGDGLADAVLTSGSPLTGIVLDLRASTGGLLNVSVAIAAAFLPKNALIVYTTGRAADSSLRLYASPEYYVRSGQKDPYTGLPAEAKTARMVVLVSKTTAAGAEAVAGALQDHKRATIVGTNTFGKGFVETILALEGGGALKITTASMHRPSGNALEGAGVTPDVMVQEAPGVLPEQTAEPNPDLGLEEAVRILRAQ